MSRTRRRISPCERRVSTTGKIYKIKRVSKVRGKGKYVRTAKDLEATSKRMRGNVCPSLRFTKTDKRRQREEMKKMVKATREDVLAGRIPKLSDMVSHAQAELEKSTEYQLMKNDNAKMQKMIAVVFLAAAQYGLKLYENLKPSEKVARKYNSYFVKPFTALGEQARKALDSANEIEHGRKLTIDKKGKFEDALDKLNVIDAEGREIIDDNTKSN